MAAAVTEHSPVPFHLGLIEPRDETAITDLPEIEGAYDPVEQIWKLPAGTDPTVIEAYFFTETYCYIQGKRDSDDGHTDA
jgi:hypothetical protein